MKPSPALVILSCLVLLATCQLQQPIDLASIAHIPATPRPIASPPTAKPIAVVPTMTSPPLPPTIAQVLPTQTLVPPQSGTLKLAPVTPLAVGRAWTYWRAVDTTQGIQTIMVQGEALWVGTSYGLYRVDPHTGSFVAYEEVGPISMLLPIGEDQLWAFGTDGLFFFDGQYWAKANSGGGASSDGSMGIDRQGDLWLFGHEERFGGRVSSHFSGHIPPDGAWSYDFYRPYQVPKSLWYSLNLTDCTAWSVVTSHEFGFYYRTPAECQAVKAARDSQNGPRYTSDRDGNVWWVTGGESWGDLTRTLHHRLERFAVDQKLPTARLENATTDQTLAAGIQVHSLAPDPDNGVWLGTDRGLFYSDGNAIQEIPLAQDQHTLRAMPRNIAIDTQGTAWIITAQGVQKLPAHKSQWQDVHDFGLHGSINSWALGTLAAAREGGIWATHGQDLWRFGGSTSTPLLTAPLPDPSCRLLHLSVDPAGNVWSPLGNYTAHTIVFMPETSEWHLDPPNMYAPQWPPIVQFTNSPDVGTIRDKTLGPDGRMWLVGDRGIAVYDPRKDWQP